MEQNTLFLTRKVNVDAAKIFEFFTAKGEIEKVLPPTSNKLGSIKGDLITEGANFDYSCSLKAGGTTKVHGEVKRVVKDELLTLSWQEDS